MLRCSELINNFAYGDTTGKASNLYIEGDVLVNYVTPIAFRTEGGIVLNKSKYSMTTSKNQNLVRRTNMVVAELEENEFNKALNKANPSWYYTYC